MPEIPDLAVYAARLEDKLVGKAVLDFKIDHPFVLRSVEPAPSAVVDHQVIGAQLLGKRIALLLENELAIVIHLMVAGRLRWRPPDASYPRRQTMARLIFEHGYLLFTEAGSKRRASLHLSRGNDALAAHHPGGIDPLSASLSEFTAAIHAKSHILKRALTDQSLLAGIGNAYSDEILHHAGLSPFLNSRRLSEQQIEALFEATKATLSAWIERLSQRHGEFPDKVTAFQPEMAVHGKFGQPCPTCHSTVQRIVYQRRNEMNYCPGCQTNGRLLADRALSRLLKDDWPDRAD